MKCYTENGYFKNIYVSIKNLKSMVPVVPVSIFAVLFSLASILYQFTTILFYIYTP